jgi:ketosteroid isomerase-like protein
MKTKLAHALAAACTIALSACTSGDDDVTVSMENTPEDALDGSELAAGAPSLAEQVAIIEQRVSATNTRDWDTWEALHTADAVRTAPELEEPLRGAPAMRAAIEGLSAAFPDYHLELTQAFGQGQWLAVRLHTTGTMTGPLTLSDGVAIPATGQPIEQDWAALVRFDGDRIAEFHEYYDQLLLMQQLGLVGP